MKKAFEDECSSSQTLPLPEFNSTSGDSPSPIRRRVRGRRSSGGPTCRSRLTGWLRNVVRRSPIWGDVDLEAFCRLTEYSREHATRELSRIRRSGEFAFETKIRTRAGRRGRNWGVIVADPKKLRFDRHSLHFASDGRPLHNRTTLAEEGVKLLPVPTSIEGVSLTSNPECRTTTENIPSSIDQSLTSPGRASVDPKQILKKTAPVQRHLKKGTGCDNAYKEDSYGIQQSERYGAGRPIALWRGPQIPAPRLEGMQRLRRRAFALVEKLKDSQWDNCKVQFDSRGAFALAYGALSDGHDAARIIRCYELALFKSHGHAVDKAASGAKIVFFNISSTIIETRRLLEQDGFCREDRINAWYARRNTITAEIKAAFAALEQTLGNPGKGSS